MPVLTIEQLMDDFPVTTDRAGLLRWLGRVFELWDDGQNDTVTELRDDIAIKVAKKFRLLPNPELPNEPPNHRPGDEVLREYLLVFAINTLITYDENLRGVNCWFFTETVKDWLGERQPKA
jgi:hypothetical protein